MIGASRFLPSVYTVRGLRAAQGLVFMDSLSALQWLAQKLPEGIPEHVTVEPAEVIYYGGALASHSTEDLQKKKMLDSPKG
jgi:hypothetical protein